MHAALRISANVLPGSRIEFSAPELIEGERVDIVVMPSRQQSGTATPSFASAADYLMSLPPIIHSKEEWDQIEREMREERDAWGD